MAFRRGWPAGSLESTDERQKASICTPASPVASLTKTRWIVLSLQMSCFLFLLPQVGCLCATSDGAPCWNRFFSTCNLRVCRMARAPVSSHDECLEAKRDLGKSQQQTERFYQNMAQNVNLLRQRMRKLHLRSHFDMPWSCVSCDGSEVCPFWTLVRRSGPHHKPTWTVRDQRQVFHAWPVFDKLKKGRL